MKTKWSPPPPPPPTKKKKTLWWDSPPSDKVAGQRTRSDPPPPTPPAEMTYYCVLNAPPSDTVDVTRTWNVACKQVNTGLNFHELWEGTNTDDEPGEDCEGLCGVQTLQSAVQTGQFNWGHSIKFLSLYLGGFQGPSSVDMADRLRPLFPPVPHPWVQQTHWGM